MIRHLTLAAAFLPSLAAAHPHLAVEQQLHISLSTNAVHLSWMIAPSEDGGRIFDHVDTNADGRLDEAERTAFANNLIAATVLTIDGSPVNLEPIGLKFPDRHAVLTGSAVIEASALAERPVASATSVTARIDYGAFSEDWFIQPFYDAGLRSRTSPSVIREERALIITIPDVPISENDGF